MSEGKLWLLLGEGEGWGKVYAEVDKNSGSLWLVGVEMGSVVIASAAVWANFQGRHSLSHNLGAALFLTKCPSTLQVVVVKQITVSGHHVFPSYGILV